jgi:Major Facilitator Superfamily
MKDFNNAKIDLVAFKPHNMTRSIAWRQVWGLAILLVAVMFCWMVYGFYQPKILASLGFIALAQYLGIIQGLLGAIVEPIVGWKSDQIFRKLNTRFPMITVGVTLAGLIFVLTAVLLESPVVQAVRWVVPVLMTVWVIAMIIFRGPAIALLRQFAPTDQLPKANAILTLVFGLVGAIGPLIENLITTLGGTVTFLLGALTLTVGALIFKSSNPQLSLPPAQTERPITIWTAIAIFGVGLAAGIQTTVLLRYCPLLLQAQIPWSAAVLASLILLISGLVALPLERVAFAWGIRRAMLISLLSIVLLCGVLLLSSHLSILVLILAGIAFGLLFISQIPYALQAVPSEQAGFGTGLYFGGIGGGSAIAALLLGDQPVAIGVFGLSLLGGAIAVVGLFGE